MADTVPCRGCGAPMRWVTMAASGKKNPLNPEPDRVRGNVEIRPDGTGQVITDPEDLKTLRADPQGLFLSHFVSCPAAKSFKKGGGR